MAWSRRFIPAIPLPDGGELITLQDAGRYIQKLPPAEHDLPHWRNAVEALLLVTEHNGDPMFARIAMMQALLHGQPAAPRRKRAKKFNLITNKKAAPSPKE